MQNTSVVSVLATMIRTNDNVILSNTKGGRIRGGRPAMNQFIQMTFKLTVTTD